MKLYSKGGPLGGLLLIAAGVSLALPVSAEPNYRMLRVGGGNCLDVAGNSTASNASVVHWQCHGGDNQLWRQDSQGRLQPRHAPGMCLEAGLEVNQGSDAFIYPCHGNPHQQWQFDGNILRNVARPEMVLDQSLSGSTVHVWSYHGGENQQWSWVEPEPEFVTSEHERLGFTATIQTFNAADFFAESYDSYVWRLAAQPSQSSLALSSSTGLSQSLTPLVEGDYEIEIDAYGDYGHQATATIRLSMLGSLYTTQRYPDLCISVLDDAFTGGSAPVDVTTCAAEPGQRWTLDSQGRLHSALDYQYCIEGSALYYGGKLSAQPCDTSPAQQWSGSDGALRNGANSNLAMDVGSGPSLHLWGFHGNSNQRWSSTAEAAQLVAANQDVTVSYPISISDVDAIALEDSRDRLNRAVPADQPLPVNREVSQYPGIVPADAPRVSKTLDFDRRFNHGEHLRAGAPVRNWQSTGLYAPAGQVLTVTLANASEADLEGVFLLINEHTDTLDASKHNVKSSGEIKRFSSVTRRYALKPGTQILRSQYGGQIVLESRHNADLTLQVAIDGAVQAPHFVAGQTSLSDWQETRNALAPWATLEGSRAVLIVPSEKVRNLDDPEALLQGYDYVVMVHDYLSGLDPYDSNPLHQPQTGKHRFVEDIQISAGSAHAGFPMMFGPYYDLSREGYATSDWVIWHELGHNYQQRCLWSYRYGTEVTVNLFSLFAQELFTQRSRLVENNNYSAAIALLNDASVSDKWGTASVWEKLVFLMQIKHAFPQQGWSLYQQLNRYFRELPQNEADAICASGQRQWDEFYIQMSRLSGHDLIGHFEKWTIPVSADAKAEVAALGLPTPASPVWQVNPE